MVFKNLCVLVLWTKVASACVGLSLNIEQPADIRGEYESSRGKILRLATEKDYVWLPDSTVPIGPVQYTIQG